MTNKLASEALAVALYRIAVMLFVFGVCWLFTSPEYLTFLLMLFIPVMNKRKTQQETLNDVLHAVNDKLKLIHDTSIREGTLKERENQNKTNH